MEKIYLEKLDSEDLNRFQSSESNFAKVEMEYFEMRRKEIYANADHEISK